MSTGLRPQPPIPAYEGDDPYFFVCYAHEDSDEVFSEMRWISAAGFNLWYDDGIHIGTVWRRVLAEALEGASGLIFMQTAQAVQSEFCLNEMRFALDEQKPIFIAQLQPSSLPAELRLSLGDRQALIRENLAPEAYREKLSQALRDCLGGTHAAPPRGPESHGPAQRLRQRRRQDREQRIFLTTVAAIEELEASATQPIYDSVTAGGGEVLGREGNTVFASFDSITNAVDAVSHISVPMRAGISGGDVLFEDNMLHGTPMLEAAQLRKTAGSGEILCASRVATLISPTVTKMVEVAPVVVDGGKPMSVMRIQQQALPAID